MGYYAITGKFPFWSEIIESRTSHIVVNANSTGTLTIQPSAAETWWISVNCVICSEVSGSYIRAYLKVGTSSSTIDYILTRGSSGITYPHVRLNSIIKNNKYLYLAARNESNGSSASFYCGYSGFKLSERLWSPKGLNENIEILPDERKVTKPIPNKFSAFEDIIVEKLTEDERGRQVYKHAIVLEKDVPLAIDEKTNHIVERYSMYCFLDDFEDILNRYKERKLDLERSGWKKYIDQFEEEGRL